MASVKRATEAAMTQSIVCFLRIRSKCMHTCGRHESTEYFHSRLCLALLRLAQNFETLFARIFRQTFEIFLRAFLCVVRRINHLHEYLSRLECFVLRRRVDRLEYLHQARIVSKSWKLRMFNITSSLKEFHNFRANSRATTGPYTGRQTSRVTSVSLWNFLLSMGVMHD